MNRFSPRQHGHGEDVDADLQGERHHQGPVPRHVHQLPPSDSDGRRVLFHVRAYEAVPEDGHWNEDLDLFRQQATLVVGPLSGVVIYFLYLFILH